MKREFDFSKEFGEIGEKLVENAGKEWKKKKCDAFRLYGRKIAAVASIALLCIVAANNSRVQAAVKQFTTKIGEALGFEKDLSAYAEIINQTQTKNGISLTLKEVILDDRVLMVSVDMGFEGAEEVSLWIDDEKTLINGQRHMTYESFQADGFDTDMLESEQGRVLGQIYEDQVLPKGEMNVYLVIRAGKMDALPKPNESIEGLEEFVYEFSITPEELKAKTVKQELDITVGVSGKEKKNLTLKELTMNDLYCRIITEGITWDDDWPNQYELKLKGTDSFGNPVSLARGAFLSENEMLFATDFLGDYESGEVIEENEFRLSVPDKDCDYLDLQLYERKIIWNDTEESLEEDEEYDMQESVDDYLKEENYGWEPIGKPFRIEIVKN